jgi:flagellar basal body-associated protein FliL
VTWKRAIIFGGCVLLFVVAFVVYYVYIDKKPSQTAAKGSKESQATTAAHVPEPVYFDNLTAVISDLSGKQRVVLFGIAAIPGKGAVPNYDGKDQDIRVAASKAVCGAPFPELMNDKGREQIKRKIKDAIEIVKGPGMVENVYITSWTIL